MAAITASPARATDDLDGYQGEEKKNVTVTTNREFKDNQTTFTFELKTNGENVSHVLLVTCPGVDIVSVTGPNGANKKNSTPENDPSLEHEHTGIKFEPGAPGVYTIVFVGNIAAADFIVKDGTGHKHYPAGSPSDVCKTVTTSETTPTTVGGNTTPTTTGGNTTPTTTGGNTTPTTTGSNPGTNPASDQPSQPDTQVQGAQQTNNPPGSEVLAGSLSQPEAQATLPRTGSDVTLLVPIGALLVAFGGMARAAARRS